MIWNHIIVLNFKLVQIKEVQICAFRSGGHNLQPGMVFGFCSHDNVGNQCKLTSKEIWLRAATWEVQIIQHAGILDRSAGIGEAAVNQNKV
jgi:hypothetical protein